MGSQDPDNDVRRIEKVAAALAGRASLRIDLNAAWDELTATRYLPRLQDAGIALVEQPLPAWNVDGMAGSASDWICPSWPTKACAANTTRYAWPRPAPVTSSR
jgi:L-alanine-DL-glutamate epimerase-like enolase superfamily enzyme